MSDASEAFSALMTGYIAENDARWVLLREAMRYVECHEDVTRKGESQPCENIAVAVRIDPNEGGFYPVCSRHTRRPMVRLADLAACTVPHARTVPPEGTPDD